MSGTEVALIMASCGTLVTAITSAYGVFVTIRNAQEAREQRGVIVDKLEAVHEVAKQVQVETDGMKSELVKEVRAASFAKGVKSETDKKP